MKRIIAILVSMFLLATVGCSDDRQASQNKPAAAQKAAQNSASAASASRANSSASIFRSITPLEAKSLMESRRDLLVVDLREAKELREGYIDGSQLIPMSALAKGDQALPADQPLLLICAVGGRSYGVGRYFSAKGYPEIYNLKGGISAWKRAGLPLKY